MNPLSIPKTPKIPESERTPLVARLLEIIAILLEHTQALKDEIARLKAQKPKPKIPPSRLEDPSRHRALSKVEGKRPGSAKRSKTAELEIHETVVVKADGVPPGSTFKGYEDYAVQGLLIQAHNTMIRRERWTTPDGNSVVAPLPPEVKLLDGGHFDRSLIRFVLYQYYQAHVTQPLLLEELLEIGIDISAGQINRIITEGHDSFHAEKGEILRTGLEVSSYVNVDDTGARHKGKNGHCTYIGNELFAWFESTASKSRINFLGLLRAGYKDYVLDDTALEYMRQNKLPQAQLRRIEAIGSGTYANDAEWKALLATLEFVQEHHIRIATEGSLMASVLEHGVSPGLGIVSDDAGQFNVLVHGLCWIHAERTINKLVGCSDEQRKALEDTRGRIWDLYDDLKAYKQSPSAERKAAIETDFDEIFTAKTGFATLDQALERLHKNKSELLMVLERPDLPIHNNGAEEGLRDYVKIRKVSGGTRSDLGRRCRDTFASLKKTCRKLGISFWRFLGDRLGGDSSIPHLADLIRLRGGG